jgi:dTDP-4-amino-4,6-dideoxygalactose transaminase
MQHLTQPKTTMERTSQELAVFGFPPAFSETLHVGRPNLGNRASLQRRIDDMLDRKWFSNAGPLVTEFEKRICEHVGVKHCITMCNATIALEIAFRALGLRGEVIIPAYTFVATAHALKWQEITPVFADMEAGGYNIDPEKIESLITPRTTGIVGVHVWGRPCDTEAIQRIAERRNLTVLYDAAHAFGCSIKGRMVGNFGACEVFSFHATKFLNSFEGGAVVTNDDALAEKLRLMRNFGFSGYDRVVYLGINGKMTEVCAAMGLTSLESIGELIAVNSRNHQAYKEALKGMPGVSLMDYPAGERANFQYIVVRIDPSVAPLDRDELVEVLHAENVLARKYFWPGCHRMEPYASDRAGDGDDLQTTNRVASEVVVLPTGQSVRPEQIVAIAGIIRSAFERAGAVRERLLARAAFPAGGDVEDVDA